MTKKQWGQLLGVFGTALILYISLLKFGSRIDVEGVKTTLSKLGPWAPAGFILLTATTNLVAPLPTLPFWIAGIIFFPFPASFLYISCANYLGHTLIFTIAKYLGRPAVRRLVGEQALAKIEQITCVTKPRCFAIFRLLGGAATDYISYAAGLSQMSYKMYVPFTVVGLLPVMLTGMLVIRHAVTSTTSLSSSFTFIAIFSVLNYLMTLTVPTVMVLEKRRSANKPNV